LAATAIQILRNFSRRRRIGTRPRSCDGSIERAEAGDAVTLIITEDLDVSRGDMLAAPTARPEVSEQFAAHIIWMDHAKSANSAGIGRNWTQLDSLAHDTPSASIPARVHQAVASQQRCTPL
jgi:sulfate adenylyltransferase subunit 1 (EFTu-like GTPase family)